MKKQMIARLRKLLIIHGDKIEPTIKDCYDFLVPAVFAENKNALDNVI